MRRLAIVGMVVALAGSVSAQNSCPCPQSDLVDYETDTTPQAVASLNVCTADGCGSLALGVVHRIVTPATTDGSTPPDSPHYLAVESNNNSSFPEPGPVTLKTQAGALFQNLQLLQPRFFFDPCSKSLVSLLPAPPPGPGFLCSKVRPQPRLHITFVEKDEFGSSNCALDRIAFVCRRADVGVTPAAADWLICFSFNKGGSSLFDPASDTAFVNSLHFGSFVFGPGRVHPADEFCFPATQQ